MVSFYTFASSSSGNCMLISDGRTHLLIDAGISCRRIQGNLSSLGLSLCDLSGILITHNHSDHIAGCKTIAEKVPIPFHASVGTAQALRMEKAPFAPAVSAHPVGVPFSIGSFTVTSFSTLHDAPDSVGYRLEHEDGTVGILTDTGHVPQEARSLLSSADLLVLESNYDDTMLTEGPYPYSLKVRIRGDHGHLSNEESSAFLVEMSRHAPQAFLLAHLSKENNRPELALAQARTQLHRAGCSLPVFIAPRDSLSQEFRLCRKSLSFVSEN